MGKMKEKFGELQQQDMLDADYQYEQWLETQKLEESYFSSNEFKQDSELQKNLSDGDNK